MIFSVFLLVALSLTVPEPVAFDPHLNDVAVIRNRYNSAVVIFGSPNTADHFEKLKFVVMITLVRSYKRFSK